MTKSVSGQVRANAAFTQQDENGQVVSPNGTGQVIDGNVQTDIGHVSSFENKYEVKYSEKAGLTQQAHNQMFSNPGQFQVEPSRENRSHAFENHDENDAMMNISAYACGGQGYCVKNHDYSAGERQRHGNACCEECEDRRNGAHRHLCVGASGGIGTSFGRPDKVQETPAGQSAGKRHAGNRACRNLETGNTGNGGGFCGDIQGNCAGVGQMPAESVQNRNRRKRMRRHRRQTRRTWQSRMRQNLLKAMPEKHLLRRKNPRRRHRNPRKLMQRARQRQALPNLLTAMRRELRRSCRCQRNP